MTVWIVERDYDYEGKALLGIFSTEEKAETYAESQRKSYRSASHDVTEVTVDALVPVQSECDATEKK